MQPKFKVGDRVIAKPNNQVNGLYNLTGKIITYTDDYSMCVEFDKYMNGHSEGGKGKDGYCWWVSGEGFDKIEVSKIEAGDLVEVTDKFGEGDCAGARGLVFCVYPKGFAAVKFYIDCTPKLMFLTLDEIKKVID